MVSSVLVRPSWRFSLLSLFYACRSTEVPLREKKNTKSPIYVLKERETCRHKGKKKNKMQDTASQKRERGAPPEAQDADEAVRSVLAQLQHRDHAVVPLCPDGVKQEPLTAALGAHGIWCARMGTGNARRLFASGRPVRLLFRHLSPCTRAHLATNVPLLLFRVPPSEAAATTNHGDDLYATLPHVDGSRWLDVVSRAIHELGGEKRFVDLHRRAMASVAAAIEASPGFREWASAPPADEAIAEMRPSVRAHPVRGAASGSDAETIYHPANDGAHFVEIDLESANFQALRNAGLIADDSWTAFARRPDIAPCASAAEYVGAAKRLRMLSLSAPSLRPDLQRAAWSRATLDALDLLLERGAVSRTDLAQWNSDEIILHALDESDARNRTERCARILAESMPQWSFRCRPFRLDALAPPIGPGFLRTRLDSPDAVPLFKCVDPARLQATLNAWWRPSMKGTNAGPPWPDAECIVPPGPAEARQCDLLILAIVRSGDRGLSMDEARRHFVDAKVPPERAGELAAHVADERGRSLVAVSPSHERLVAAWRAWGGDSARYRRRAWPDVDETGRDGPRSALVPPGAVLVDTAEACAKAARVLLRCPVVALDCEGIVPGCDDLGLVQVCGAGGDCSVFLFDMLAPGARRFLGPRGGLGRVLRSRCVTKVVHDCRGDFVALASKYGCEIVNLFDTQVAYGLVVDGDGATARSFGIGLNDALARFARANEGDAAAVVNRDKKAVSRLTTHDNWCWHRRPLPTRLLRYAVADVAHLVRCYDGLMAALGSAERRQRAYDLSHQRAIAQWEEAQRRSSPLPSIAPSRRRPRTNATPAAGPRSDA
jgi:hypothetical protein